MLIIFNEMLRQSDDIRLYGRQWPCGIQNDESVRLRNRLLQVTFAYSCKELMLFPFNAIGLAAIAGSSHADFDGRVEQNSKVWPKVGVNPVSQLIHHVHRQAPAAALIGPAGIGKSIANHPFAGLQCWSNVVIHIQRPCREHQQQLRDA